MRLTKWSFIFVCFILATCIGLSGCTGNIEASVQNTAAIIDEYESASNSQENNAYITAEAEASQTPEIIEVTTSPEQKDAEDIITPSPTAIAPTATKAPAVTASPAVTIKPTVKPTVAPTAKPVITPKPTVAPKLSLDTLLGQSELQIVSAFGQPKAKELSEYGFMWYVYNANYSRFIMIGISSGKVVGVYSNSSALTLEGLTVGKTKDAVRATLAVEYKQPITSIQKGNIRYVLSNTAQKDVFFNGISYTTVFYDNILGGKLTAVQIIAKDTEMTIGYFAKPSTALASSMERISFYLVNAVRCRMGKTILIWDDKMAGIARAHSKDMFVRNFFNHLNPDGLNSSARIKAAGVVYSRCAENIAKNHPSAIYSHESYMNSQGHRDNILRDVKNLGVGVYMEGNSVLLTQDFVTYR